MRSVEVPKEYIRCADIAASLGVSSRYINRILGTAKLPLNFLRIGRAIYIPRAEWDSLRTSQIQTRVQDA